MTHAAHPELSRIRAALAAALQKGRELASRLLQDFLARSAHPQR